MRLCLLLCLLPLLIIGCTGDDSSQDTPPPPNDSPLEEAASNDSDVPVYSRNQTNQGSTDYSIYCIQCHGVGARGMAGLGPNLVSSEFVGSRSDAELLAFVQAGRPADHPDNLSGVTMPARGGFPNLGDEQILNIIAYIRSLR